MTDTHSDPADRTAADIDADDPYIWLEDVSGERSLDWVRAHNAPTVAALTSGDRFADLQASAQEVLDTDERIPYARRRGEYLYNFWRDATNTRGLWRRTDLDSYRTEDPVWDVLVDLDQLAESEGENWVWQSASVLRPDYDRALISLSRGGADAAVVREFDLIARTWVEADSESNGFALSENKYDISWIDRDTVFVGTDFGVHTDGLSSLTDSGYPRVVKRWTRGTPLDAAETVFVGDVADVAVQVGHDHTPGFERDFLVRATDFFHQEMVELRPDGEVEIPVPTDAHTMIRCEWLFVLTRSD